jgi:YVTN family beta-propeller protein
MEGAMARAAKLERLILVTLGGALASWGCGGGEPTAADGPPPPAADGALGPPGDGPVSDGAAAPPDGRDGGSAPGPEAGADGAAAAGVRKTPTNGSAIAITADDRWAVAANRTAGRVTVFRLDLAGGTWTATRTADLDVGKTSEPWSVVIGNDDDTAYVILRQAQQVVRLKGLRGTPTVDATRAPTGSEPTGVAISPTGKILYVANWADGTVSQIDATALTVTRTIDLNGSLAASGALGSGVTARPGLAHPRAVVVTNNGNTNDGDERVYATEFFSQASTSPLPADDSQFDLGRVAVVYHFDAGSGTVGTPITIAPIADTGFPDSKGQTTGCFPNQLYAAALNANRLYVTSVCESPRGPVGPDAMPMGMGSQTSNFKTQVHAAVFVIDTVTNKEIPAQGLLLTREFTKLYTTLGLPDDASRRLPLIPNDIMFAAGTTFAYVSSYGSDAVFRIAYKPDGSVEAIGSDKQPFINLGPPEGNIAAGVLPVGVASANTGTNLAPLALAINENSRNLSVISFNTQTVTSAVAATDLPADELPLNRGRKFFATGLGRWSLSGQAWNSCGACHPDGLTDNVTWFFARGPRQTIALDASYDPQNPARRRILNWTAIFDEIHDFEGNTRGNSGGVGAIVHRAPALIGISDRIIFEGTPLMDPQQVATMAPQAGLNGSTVSLMPNGPIMPLSVLDNWNDIDAYVKTIRSPRGAQGLNATDVAAGRQLFEANNCAGCHGGSQWTLSNVFYTPNDANNKSDGLLRMTEYTRPAMFPAALNPPSSGATAKASLRLAPANAGDAALNDQINCALRSVGTFPMPGAIGVPPFGVVVKEVRQDMTTASQGATGFNIPSLLGMVTGAPYYHAGNARTLEEALGDSFDKHRRALAENFRPDAIQIRQLAAYLVSIDETTTAHAVPALGFAVDLCSQTPPGVIR